MKCKDLATRLLLVVAVVTFAHTVVADVIVQNPGFEDTVLGSEKGFYQTATQGNVEGNLLPPILGWTFSDSTSSSQSGMLSASGIDSWGVPAFGSQCAAFTGNATITQAVTGFAAGTATFSFYAQGYNGPLTVKLDGTPLNFSGVASVTPVGAPGGPMIQYTSDSVAVTAGEHAIQFQASAWTFVDNVSVTNHAIPEPSSVTLLVAGLFGLLAYAWRKHK